jgi:TRAP-type C4-dicarboxylate transport system substrate-binding protein
MEMRDAWRRASAGSVDLIVRGAMADGAIQLVKKLRAGQFQAALVSAVGLAQLDKSVTCLQLMPLQFRDWREVDYVREKLRGDLEARLRAQDFEVLFWADAGWVRFFSKAPAVHPADLKPMKMFVWTGEPHQMTILRTLGYSPIGLETEQIIPSLASGMISVVPVPPFLANALQYQRYTGHMIDLNWVPIVGAAVVRREVWHGIGQEQRARFLALAERTGEQIRQRAREEDDAAITAMKKRGLVVHTPTEAQTAAWGAVAQQAYPLIRGKMVPADLFDRVQAHLAEFRDRQPARK